MKEGWLSHCMQFQATSATTKVKGQGGVRCFQGRLVVVCECVRIDYA